ncbi:MAG: EamA family transporter [Candidatus Lokiarchaeota archaeon]|nr:EamA family transporter [Candidatus Lokiarchaeota archaeon]MBD3202249.1 EamA family transporter [Candidatus Lokiarchaeota archaeon]
MKLTEKSQGYLILILAVFTWSFSEIIVRLLHGSVGPLSLSFFRFFIGGLFMLIILGLRKDFEGIHRLMKNNLLIFLISSCFAFGFSNIIYFVGVTLTLANIAATIYTTYPIWITIYSIFILNEKDNLKYKFIGVSIGILGVFILLTNFNFIEFFSSQYLLGNLLVLLGSIIWSLYSVLGKKIQKEEQQTSNVTLKYAMTSSFFACIPILLILPFTSEITSFFVYDITSWFWIIFLGIISTGLGIWLLFEGINRLEVSKGMSLAFLKPIFATILSFFILAETPSINLMISILLVICSIILINRQPSLKNEK